MAQAEYEHAGASSRLRMSVALCTYNGGAYLQEQLQSIRDQSRLPDEVVICDDGSSDGTGEIINAFAHTARFPVRVFTSLVNLGSTKNFEKAIGLCQGDVIVLADQDDCWYDHRLASVEEALLDNPAVGLVFSDADLIDADSRPLNTHLWDTYALNGRRRRQIASGSALQVLLRHNVVTGATMAFRAEFRDVVLPVPAAVVHDLWIAVILSVVSKIGILPSASIRYRKHSAQQVGVLNYNFREAIEKARAIGPAEYLSLASHYAAVRDRIRERCPGAEFEAKLELLERKISHMNMRAALPADRWRRMRMIVRDTLNLNYFRYAEGCKSIAKDLLR